METKFELFRPGKQQNEKKNNMKDQYNLDKLKRRSGPVKSEPEASRTMISLRLDCLDLSALKDEAERLGMPYQTLISSIIHRFVNGELIDKKEVRKLVK